MADANLSTRALRLDGVSVWYDADADALYLTSSDAALDRGVLDIQIEQGTAADRELREAFAAYGMPLSSTPTIAPLRPQRSARFLRFAAGITPCGETLVFDLIAQSHLVLRGAIGAGRTSMLRGIITELAAGATTETLDIQILGRGPLSISSAVDPHQSPVVQYACRDSDAGQCLQEIARQMSVREDALAGAGADSIDTYNATPGVTPLRRTVVVIDCAETAPLDWDDPDAVEVATESLDRLLTDGPQLGMHAILAHNEFRANIVAALDDVPTITLAADGPGVCSLTDGSATVQFMPFGEF